MKSTTCFEPEGSSSQKTRVLILMHVKCTIAELYIQPSSLDEPSGSKHILDSKK